MRKMEYAEKAGSEIGFGELDQNCPTVNEPHHVWHLGHG